MGQEALRARIEKLERMPPARHRPSIETRLATLERQVAMLLRLAEGDPVPREHADEEDGA
jgi:hypothetical protein